MRKVVGFKLGIRVKEVQRRAKRARFDLLSAGLGEPELQPLVEQAQRAITPAVLFETFAHPDAEQALLAPMPGLAYSLVLASLGPRFAPAKDEAARADAQCGVIWGLVQDAALDEALRFATNILVDDAVKDACELSPLNALASAEALAASVKKLDGAKIGVSFSGGSLSPSASAACSLSWLAKAKPKKK